MITGDDKTSPSVLRTDPVDGATGKTVKVVPAVFYNEEVHLANNTAVFTIANPSNTLLAAGTVLTGATSSATARVVAMTNSAQAVIVNPTNGVFSPGESLTFTPAASITFVSTSATQFVPSVVIAEHWLNNTFIRNIVDTVVVTQDRMLLVNPGFATSLRRYRVILPAGLLSDNFVVPNPSTALSFTFDTGENHSLE